MNTAELRRLYEAATPDEWEINEPAVSGYVQIVGNIEGDACDDGSLRIIHTHVCDIIDNDNEQANAAFIAAAHNSMPALLDAVEERDRLMEALETMECAIRHYAYHQPLHAKRPHEIQRDLLAIAGDEHHHVKSIGDDRCLICGHDLRHEVHTRAPRAALEKSK